MNVTIRNKETGHQQSITKESWENGKQWYVGYDLTGDEPELITEQNEKHIPKPIVEEVEFADHSIEETKQETETQIILSEDVKPKRRRKKKPKNDPE